VPTHPGHNALERTDRGHVPEIQGRSSKPVIQPNPTRKKLPPSDQLSYKSRNVIERAFCHLKDWRRAATRYDKLVRNFQATVALAVIFA